MAATIFVDHHSSASYIHLQESTTAVETIIAKNAFKLWARDQGVTITHYHANNGRFTKSVWKADVD